MPVVPRYEGPQVNAAPLPQVRFRAADTGAEKIGQGLQAVGSVVGQFAQKQRDEADTLAVMKAENEAAMLRNDLQYGEHGAYRLQGEAAFGAPEQYMPRLEKGLSEIGGRLVGRQRQLFEQRTASWKPDFQAGLMRHVAGESERVKAQTMEGTIAAQAETARLNYTMPEKVDAAVLNATGAYLALNAGEPGEYQALQIRKIETVIRSGVVDRFIDDRDYAGAEAYLEQYGPRMSQDVVDAKRDKLRPLQIEAEGISVADTALAGGMTTDALANAANVAVRKALSAGKTLAEANAAGEAVIAANAARRDVRPRTFAEQLAWVREEIPDATDPVRKQAEQVIRQRESEREAIEADDKQARSERVFAAVMNAPNPGAPLSSIVGAADYQRIVESGHAAEYQEMLDARIKRTVRQSDVGFVDDMERLALTDPAKFARVDFLAPEVAGKLSNDALAWMQRTKADILKPENGGRAADWSSEAERLEVGYRALGIQADAFPLSGATGDERVKAEAARDQRYQFSILYRQAAQQYQQTNGKAPDATAADTIVRSLVRQTAMSPKGRAVALQNAEAFDRYSIAITPAQRAEAVANLRAAGYEPTQAAIVRWVAKKYPQKAK